MRHEKKEELLKLFCDFHQPETDWVGNKSIIASTVMTDDVMTIPTSVMCVNFTIYDYYYMQVFLFCAVREIKHHSKLDIVFLSPSFPADN